MDRMVFQDDHEEDLFDVGKNTRFQSRNLADFRQSQPKAPGPRNTKRKNSKVDRINLYDSIANEVFKTDVVAEDNRQPDSLNQQHTENNLVFNQIMERFSNLHREKNTPPPDQLISPPASIEALPISSESATLGEVQPSNKRENKITPIAAGGAPSVETPDFKAFAGETVTATGYRMRPVREKSENVDGLTLDDKIRRIIAENPEISVREIGKKLKTVEYGSVSISQWSLLAKLRAMGLGTKERRYRFFRST